MAPVQDTCWDLATHLVEDWSHVFCVPGRPVSHIAELTSAMAPGFEWTLNEKTAVEAAVGASLDGRSVAVLLKHNGLALALDSLANAAVHGIGAGFVVVVGDDPDAGSSTTAQDSRLLGELLSLPVIEPTLSGDVGKLLSLAAAVSQTARTPVLVRVTPQVHRACEQLADRPRRRSAPPRGGAWLEGADVAHRLTKLGRVQHRRITTMPTVGGMLDAHLGQRRCAHACGRGVISVGATRRHVPADAGCVLCLAVAWPVPDAAVAFADEHTQTWVLEDSAPQLERHLHERALDRSTVYGRLSGHLPPEGELTGALVHDALAHPRPGTFEVAERKGRPPALPDDFASLFAAVAALRRAGTFVATDVGSSVRLCYPPYDGADAALALGSAPAVASGAARSGHAAIAVLGDFGLLHSGLTSILDAVVRGVPLLTVVLVNGVQAQTGGQPVPQVDLRALLTGCGVRRIACWRDGACDADQTRDRLAELLAGPLPAVALVDSRPLPPALPVGPR